MTKSYLVAIAIFAVSFSAQARDGINFREIRDSKPQPPEIVKWIGEISDSASDHTTLHGYSLKFTNNETGKSYDIKDSPELVQIHHDNEKNYLIEIEAEKTPRFLFWGNNLIVKNFKVLNEIASVPHLAPPERTPTLREIRGGRDN